MLRVREPRGERRQKSVQNRKPMGEGARAPESREPGKKLRGVIWVGFVFFPTHPPANGFRDGWPDGEEDAVIDY